MTLTVRMTGVANDVEGCIVYFESVPGYTFPFPVVVLSPVFYFCDSCLTILFDAPRIVVDQERDFHKPTCWLRDFFLFL